tara:strand:- start:4479 stop:5774 length:1296 start_codon:yes stop_codon:yes gene_type:complete
MKSINVFSASLKEAVYMQPVNSPIDPQDININITEIEPQNLQIDFEVPQRLVKRIYKKLKKGGLDYTEQQMSDLLIQICLDEASRRIDKASIWGFLPLVDTSKPTFNIDAPFTFKMNRDVMPLDQLPSFEGIQIKSIEQEITDKLVDQELHSQKLQFGNPLPLDGPLTIGDRITGQASLYMDGDEDPLFEGKNIQIEIRDHGNLLLIDQLPFEGLFEQLVGIDISKKLTLQTKIPYTYPEKSRRGKKGTLVFDIHAAEKIEIASVDKVLEHYGTPNEVILRAQIKESLKHNQDAMNQLMMTNQLFETLKNLIDINVPEPILKASIQRAKQNRIAQNKANETLRPEEEEKIIEEAKDLLRTQAITMIMCEHLRIGVGEQDMDKQIRILAERQRKRPEDIKAEYIQRMSIIKNMCAQDKIFNELKGKLEIIGA